MWGAKGRMNLSHVVMKMNVAEDLGSEENFFIHRQGVNDTWTL